MDRTVFLGVCLVLWAGVFAPVLAGGSLTPDALARLREADRTLEAQIRQLEKSISGGRELDRYEAEYKAAIARSAATPTSREELTAKLATASVVLLSDEHTLDLSQMRTVDVLAEMSSGRGPVTLVLEWIDRKHQAAVADYLAGGLTVDALRSKIRFDKTWGFSWTGYKAVLIAAKKHGARVILAESFDGDRSLSRRDEEVVAAIRADRQANRGSRYLVVYGTYHVLGSGHLSDRLAKAGLAADLVITDEAEDLYWKALETSRDPEAARTLKLADRAYFVATGDPIVHHMAYRAYLMKLTGTRESDFSVSARKILEPIANDRRQKFEALHAE